MSRMSIASMLALAALAAPRPLVAQMPPPTLTVGGQAATFSDPVALLDAGAMRVSVLFPHTPLAAGVESAARAKGTWEDVAPSVAPAAIVDFDYTPGSTSGLVKDLKECRLRAIGFKSAWSVKGGAAQCHVVSIGGLLKSGGGIAGLLEGKGAGYALRLPFATTLLEASTPAAGPASGPAPRPATPTVALNTVTGKATYQGQTVRATHAFSWWDTRQKQATLIVQLFDHAPSAATVAAAPRGEAGDDQPVISLTLRFRGAGRDLASVDLCDWLVDYPKTGINEIVAEHAKGCGLGALAIDMAQKPAGAVQATLKYADEDSDEPSTLDLAFHIPIVK